jgi:hypothetical protein
LLQVKAVVVDSIAAPFRMVEGMQWQHQPVMLVTIGKMLRMIAARGIIVVVLNQVVGGATGGNEDIKPALGAVGYTISWIAGLTMCIHVTCIHWKLLVFLYRE